VGLIQTYAGRARYQADREHERYLLFVEVACWVGDRQIDALLDTASQWCVLSAADAAERGHGTPSDGSVTRLHTRFGLLEGQLIRTVLGLQAEEREIVDVEATWFISADWPGPPVLGWKGCLERIRFALDPGEESFYFAEL
jgi:hypothetical protein